MSDEITDVVVDEEIEETPADVELEADEDPEDDEDDDEDEEDGEEGEDDNG